MGRDTSAAETVLSIRLKLGLAALWDAEQSHESWTVTGMTVIVIELAVIQVSD